MKRCKAEKYKNENQTFSQTQTYTIFFSNLPVVWSPNPWCLGIPYINTSVYLFQNFFSIYIYTTNNTYMGFPGGSVVKNLPANAVDTGSIHGVRKIP